MAVQLSKGQRVDLTKGSKLTRAVIGLGWDVKKFTGGFDFDLDASAFLTNDQNKVQRDEDFIFYNNLVHPSGAVEHTGDNRTGLGDGDDESIIIDFSQMPNSVHKVGITVTIHDAQRRGQNFGQVYNAYVRVLNEETGEEILRYDLAEEFSIETALIVCELYRYQGEWRFSAVGSGFSGGLGALCQNYGLEVQ